MKGRPMSAPKYCRYRGTIARVFIDRKSIHLGVYGSEGSKAKYRRLIAQWSAEQPVEEVRSRCTVAEVLEAAVIVDALL